MNLQSRLKVGSLNEVVVWVIAIVLAMPTLVILGSFFLPFNEQWQHLFSVLLGDYVVNSLILMVGVSFGVLTIGVTCAWLTTMCQFPGRSWLAWALLLPMAMPAYIIAYTYTGLLDFSGPVQSHLRLFFGWGHGDYWFPPIRSIWGAIAMLSLVLYPYVYLLARAAFLEQSLCVLEVSRSLGCTPIQSFYRVAFPLARPAIVAGLSLALMETLADYGTVQYFGISTFTTGIFRVWFGMGDGQSAAQLAGVLLLFVSTLIILELMSRKKLRFHHTSSRYSRITRYQLIGWQKIVALLVCLFPLLAGFIIPALQLLHWALFTSDITIDADFLWLIWHSLYLATMTACLAVFLALVLAYAKRLRNNAWTNILVRLAGSGYAIPGTVIAVGVMLPLAWFDNQFDAWSRQYLNFSPGLLLSGTLFALIFAYLVRFLSASLQSTESGLAKIKHSIDDAGRTLGLTPMGVLRKIHLPMMSSTILTALILVFVDVLKELPATLILRPFNFNTLAVKAYELASDERLADVGAPALMIVLVGIIPVVMLSKVIDRARNAQEGMATELPLNLELALERPSRSITSAESLLK